MIKSLLAHPYSHYILLILFFFLSAYSLSSRPFVTKGEGREAVVIKSMQQQNNYILPLRNFDELPSKPPLFHQLSSALVFTTASLGLSPEFQYRLTSLLCAILLLAVTFIVTKKHSSTNIAVLSALLLLSAFGFSKNSSHARVDMCFALFYGLGMFSLFSLIKSYLGENRLSLKHLITCSAILCLSVLSKGPFGLILPMASITLFCFTHLLIQNTTENLKLSTIRKSIFSTVGKLPYLPLVLIFIVSAMLASIWYYAAYSLHGEEFLNVQVYKENLSRIKGTQAVGHLRPFYFSLIYLFAGLAPVSLLLPIAFIRIIKRFHRLKNDQFFILCLCWLITLFAAVTISSSKRIVYLLPAYPAACILIAYSLVNLQEFKCRISEKIFSIPLAISGILLGMFSIILASVAFSHNLLNMLTQQAAKSLKPKVFIDVLASVQSVADQPISLLFLIISTAALVYSSKYFSRGKVRESITALSLATILIGSFVNLYVLPSVFNNKSPVNIARKATSILKNSEDLWIYDNDLYSLSFYVDPYIKPLRDFSVLKHGTKILISSKKMVELDELGYKYEIMSKSSKYNANGRDKVFLLSIVK